MFTETSLMLPHRRVHIEQGAIGIEYTNLDTLYRIKLRH